MVRVRGFYHGGPGHPPRGYQGGVTAPGSAGRAERPPLRAGENPGALEEPHSLKVDDGSDGAEGGPEEGEGHCSLESPRCPPQL